MSQEGINIVRLYMTTDVLDKSEHQAGKEELEHDKGRILI